MCRHKSIPAARPADVSTSPSSTKSTFSSTRTSGCSRRRSSANLQWVVAARPSSSPAAASTNAPVQIDTSRVPGRIKASAAATSGDSTPSTRADGYRVPGMTTVSAVASASGPASATTENPVVAETGSRDSAQVTTS